jgi:ferredoxin-nitrite reductase
MAYNQLWKQDEENLNNVEKIKLRRDGLDVIDTIINKYSKQGIDSVSDDDKILLKWAGIYEQRPKSGQFMLRVRINTGIMSSVQAKTLASISQKYGKDFVRISTRGAIQFYNIEINDLPDIFKKLESVGLASFESCGDCPRTVVGNPLAGIDKDELMDTTDIVNEVNNFFLLNRDFSNLPRKFKISISSSIKNNGNSEINDISFTPAVKIVDGKEVIGFHFKVGGGLSTKPAMAKEVDAFVLPEDVLKVVIGTATIFRDFGYRKSRNHARLKFLIEDWGVEKFTEKLYEYTGRLPAKGIDKVENWEGSFFYGINEQKQKDRSYIGIHIPLGSFNASQLIELAEISEKFGDNLLRTTSSQNIIISGIKNSEIQEVLSLPVFKHFSPDPKTFLSHTVACTGSKFCNLALADTQKIAQKAASYIDDRLKLDTPIRINFTGCPNSCGHIHTADIGLQAAMVKSGDRMEEAFDVFIGGKLGPGAQFAQKLKGRIKEDDLLPLLNTFISSYLEKRNEEESFNEFVKRTGIMFFQEIIDNNNR